MFLQKIFPLECIKVNLEAEDKDEAFEELVDLLCQAGMATDREKLLAAVKERESKMSTGIHKGIAVPHGNTNAVDTVRGVVGISGKGIDYDALDGEPVYVLFMVFGPDEEKEMHLKTLKRMAELLEDAQFYNDLREQKDSQGVYQVIGTYENMHVALT